MREVVHMNWPGFDNKAEFGLGETVVSLQFTVLQIQVCRSPHCFLVPLKPQVTTNPLQEKLQAYDQRAHMCWNHSLPTKQYRIKYRLRCAKHVMWMVSRIDFRTIAFRWRPKANMTTRQSFRILVFDL